MRCKFRPTEHAKDRMIERGISKDDVLEVILKGAKKRKEKKILAKLRRIEVVYLQKPCNYHIVTMYRR